MEDSMINLAQHTYHPLVISAEKFKVDFTLNPNSIVEVEGEKPTFHEFVDAAVMSNIDMLTLQVAYIATCQAFECKAHLNACS